MASQDGDLDILERLYPVPLSTGITPFPGHTSQSAQALLSVLKHNYQTHHNFFNDKGFHNHATHHALAIYSLGASPEITEDAYKTAHDYLLPAIQSPGLITENNFVEHLGDARYYSAYLAFFSEYLLNHTPNETFERFIFSSSYNFDPDCRLPPAGEDGKKHPEMLNRLMSILMHPFIHLGYGFEFGIPGQIAEGELGFSIFQHKLTCGRPGIHRRPLCRPNGACAIFVLYKDDSAWQPLWIDIKALA
ncbi:hypothetical protein EI94DRAFT_1616695 [Lactarius quietus]|nr:hypothetical protein EI94DRAFT_1616695 [Lactarius quietus]